MKLNISLSRLYTLKVYKQHMQIFTSVQYNFHIGIYIGTIVDKVSKHSSLTDSMLLVH